MQLGGGTNGVVSAWSAAIAEDIVADSVARTVLGLKLERKNSQGKSRDKRRVACWVARDADWVGEANSLMREGAEAE